MTTIHDTPTRTHVDPSHRAIKVDFDTGPAEDFSGRLGRKIVRLYTAHSKDRKCLFGSLSTHVATTDGPFTVESSEPFSSPRVNVPSEPVARYNRKAHEEFVARALDLLRSAEYAEQVAVLFVSEADDVAA